jgi:hypothetical protein
MTGLLEGRLFFQDSNAVQIDIHGVINSDRRQTVREIDGICRISRKSRLPMNSMLGGHRFKAV